MPTDLFHLILLIFSLGCFILGAWQNPPSPNWNRLTSLGLAFFVASLIKGLYP